VIRERVPLSSERPTYVCDVPPRLSGLLLHNTGSTDVVVDTCEDVTADGPTAGLTVGAGQTVTFPVERDPRYPLPQVLFAVAVGGRGEITYMRAGGEVTG
jgi:hypothetical protein